MKKGPSILVVDDNTLVRRAMVTLLSKAGYQVFEANSGPTALSMMRERPPDLVLADVVMPGMDGYELCQEIKKDPDLSHIFVVNISSQRTSSKDHIIGFDTGADGYIVRPIPNEDFLARIRAFLRQKALANDLRDSREQLRRLIDQNADGMLVVDPEGHVVFSNRAAQALLGRTSESLHGQLFGHPFRTDEPVEIDVVSEDAALTNVEMRVVPVEWEGAPAFLASLRDITAHKRDAAFATAHGTILGNAIQGTDIDAILEEITRLLESTHPGTACSILLTHDKQRASWRRHSASVPSGMREFLESLDPGSPAAPWNTAVAEGRPVMVDDFRKETRWPDFIQAASHHGFQACVMLPMRAHTDEILGVMTILRRHPIKSQPADWDRIETVRHLAGVIIERRRTESRLAEQTGLLEMVLDNMADAVMAIDLRGVFVLVNRAARELLRFDDLDGANLESFLTHCEVFREDRTTPFPKAEFPIMRALQGEETNRIPMFVRHVRLKDGVAIEISGRPMRDHGGEIVGGIVVCQDLTQRILSESRLREAEDRFVAFMKNSPMLAWMVDETGRLVYVNQRFGDVLRQPPESLVTRNISELFAPEHAAQFAANNRQVFESGKSIECIEEAPLAQGGIGHYLSIKFPLQTSGGQWLAGGVAMDITDRVKSERALAESESRYRRIIETALEGIWTIDAEGRTTFANRRMHAMLGYGENEMLGRSFLEFVDETDRQAALDSFARRQQGFADEIQFRLIRKDGAELWTQVSASPITDDEGVFTGALALLTDITEKRRAEEELRVAAEDLQWIVDAQRKLSSAKLDFRESVQLILNRAQAITSAEGCTIESSEGSDLLYWAATGFLEPHVGFRLPTKTTFSGLALHTGETLRCDDTETDPRVDVTSCRHVRVRSMVVAPLRVDQDELGVLKVASTQPRAFSGRDEVKLRLLAESFGAVIQRNRAVETLKRSEAQYRLLFTSNPQPMWVFDVVSLRFLAVNPAAVAHYGYSAEEFLQMTIREIRPPEEVERLESAIRSRSPAAKAFGVWRHRRKDGSIIDVEVSSDAITFEGRYARLVMAHDVTDRLRSERELARMNRALKTLYSCNEAIIRAADEPSLVSAVCRIAAEMGGYHLAWVGYPQNDELKSVKPAAWHGSHEGYLEEICLSWGDNPQGRTPAGVTIRSGNATVHGDIANAPTLEPWRERALQHGFHSLVCLPLKSGDVTFGFLELLHDRPQAFGRDEMTLLRELADDLAYGITSLRTRNARRRTEEAVIAVARAVSSASGGEFLHSLAHSMAESLGAHAAFIARLVPGAETAAKTEAAVIGGRRVPNFSYLLRGTPCENLENADCWVVTRRAAQQYPQSTSLAEMEIESYVGRKLVNSVGETIGLLFVLFREPLVEPDFVTSILQIFASRAAAELERQSTDERLREQAALLDKAQDAIVVRDLESRVLFWNKGAEVLYGWSAEEVLGRMTTQLQSRSDSRYQQAMEAVLRDGEWSGELQKNTKSGQQLMVESRWSLVRDADGRPKSVLTINTNVTEKKRLEAQFFRAQRMESIGTLAGGIAHDLNNVLAPIMMSVDLMRLKDQTEEDRMTMDTIYSSAKRGADMVRQILTFARGTDGHRVPVDVGRILKELQKLLHETLEKSIQIHALSEPGLWPVLGDPTQLHQLFLNLCVNARDAMPTGGRLTLTAANRMVDVETDLMKVAHAKAGRYVLVTVADTGSGIPEGNREKIFDPFFTTKEIGKGTGLGLATVQAILKGHRGFVILDSQEGTGTTFEVFLPAVPEIAPADTAPIPAASEIRRGQGQTILLVDDEESVRITTKRLLEAHGYKVLLAEDGSRAVSTFVQHKDEIAAVLTDMMMPIMDGYATILALRSISPRVKIIAASGVAASTMVSKASQAGVKHFLPKPYSGMVLVKMLGDMLAE